MNTILTQADKMIRDLQQPRRPLTKWELGFVESMDDQLGRGRTPTGKQMETLEKIHEEKA